MSFPARYVILKYNCSTIFRSDLLISSLNEQQIAIQQKKVILLYRKMKNKIQLDATYYFIMLMFRLNKFRPPLCPSSGAHDDSVGYHIGRLVLELLLVGG